MPLFPFEILFSEDATIGHSSEMFCKRNPSSLILHTWELLVIKFSVSENGCRFYGF